jgi:hypothetical protein
MTIAFSTLLKTVPKPSPTGCPALNLGAAFMDWHGKGRVAGQKKVEAPVIDPAWQNAIKL